MGFTFWMATGGRVGLTCRQWVEESQINYSTESLSLRQWEAPTKAVLNTWATKRSGKHLNSFIRATECHMNARQKDKCCYVLLFARRPTTVGKQICQGPLKQTKPTNIVSNLGGLTKHSWQICLPVSANSSTDLLLHTQRQKRSDFSTLQRSIHGCLDACSCFTE